METLSFVLGLLTIASAAVLAGVVVGLLKIVKVAKQVNDLQLRLDQETQNIYREMQASHEAVWRQFECCGKDVTLVERTIMQRIDKEIEDTHRHIHDEVAYIRRHEDALEDSLHRNIDETRRYIDSRIDKVVASGTIVEPKRQVIKG